MKRANVQAKDLTQFYATCIRPILDYGAQAYHYAPPQYLQQSLERVQKEPRPSSSQMFHIKTACSYHAYAVYPADAKNFVTNYLVQLLLIMIINFLTTYTHLILLITI